MEDKENKISSNQAVSMLLEYDENGNLLLGDLNGEAERGNLTKIVEILNNVDLNRENNEGLANMRKALAILGAHDKYGYMNQDEMPKKMSEFMGHCKNGDMIAGKMYINNFFRLSNNPIDIAGFEDKFSWMMPTWIAASKEQIQSCSMNEFTKKAINTGVVETDLGDGMPPTKEEIIQE